MSYERGGEEEEGGRGRGGAENVWLGEEGVGEERGGGWKERR